MLIIKSMFKAFWSFTLKISARAKIITFEPELPVYLTFFTEAACLLCRIGGLTL